MSDEDILQQRLWMLRDEHKRTQGDPRKRVLLEKLILRVLERIENLPKPVVNW